ncbi:MAG: FAD-dependent monooxygenase [Rhodoferax sp.]|nr:FAD-dependent monooxygenase [Rhodoferax sp.]
MKKAYDVCIRGAGIVGRCLALQLAAKRLRVALLVQPMPVDAAHSDVRAYALSPASRTLLQAVRCWPGPLHATPVRRMEVRSAADTAVVFDAAQQGQPGVEALNWIVDVPELERLLTEALRFQPLVELVDAPTAAALTVICEGRASQSRTEFGIEFDTTPYPQRALAARVQCALPHGQTARQWFEASDILALLPLGGSEGRECALVWSVSPERASSLLALEPPAFCQALEAASHSTLGSLLLCSERKVWPLQAAVARRWVGTSATHGTLPGATHSPVNSTNSTNSAAWALAGDAAHNVHPLAGQGLNLGLGDVAKLVAVLDARQPWRSVGDRQLLRSYERSRKAEYALVGGSGDLLQQMFQHQHPAWQGLRNLGMRSFERSGPLKQWIARRAMGQPPVTP